MNDRRQGDRRVPPAVAQHAIEERAELLARIEDQAREIDRLSAGGAKEYWRGRCMDAEMALKAQPSGVVLPERKDPDGYSAGSPEWHAAHAHNDCMDEVALLNSPPASAGAVDERAAFEVEPEGWWNDDHNIYTWPITIGGWGARVECHGHNPAEAQQLAISIVRAAPAPGKQGGKN